MSVNVQRSLQYFVWGILPKKILGNVEQYPVASKPVINEVQPKRTIVLIMGETLRAQQLSILGYQENNTTPLLAKIEGLYSTSIFSAGTMTKTSVSALVNRMEFPGVTTQIANQDNCLFRLAKENGFKTSFYSAQNNSQMKILETVICLKYIDDYRDRDDYAKGSSIHDDVLMDQLPDIDFNENNLIVLHQRGSHTPYNYQYPPSFKAFDSEYDNTVLYTDFLLNKLINTFESTQNNELHFIFTSDHGELLGEHGRQGHGWFFEEVYKVPFLYKEHNVDNSRYDAAKKVLSHYDVSNFITSLLGYDVEIGGEGTREIYVNGSDIDALAGHLKLTVKNGEVINEELKN